MCSPNFIVFIDNFVKLRQVCFIHRCVDAVDRRHATCAKNTKDIRKHKTKHIYD